MHSAQTCVARGAAIQDAAGIEVRGYRAPSYSITKESLWALDVLVSEGYVYGFQHLSHPPRPLWHPQLGGHIHRIVRDGGDLWELPGSTVRHGRCELPSRCGGYFRLLPYGWTRRGIETLNQVEQKPAVF